MKIKKYISWFVYEKGVAIINTNTEKCLILNSSSAEVWSYIVEGKNQEEIINSLKLKYPESDDITRDVRDVISFMYKNDLLEDR